MSFNLLIVDDEKDIRDMLARHFKLVDYEVFTAGNGKEAIEILNKRRIDAVISDIMMPEMDGIQLLEYIHQEAPMCDAIMITGYVNLENALSCMRLGAEDFVFKPLEDLTEIEQAVERLVAKKKNWQLKLRELRGMKHAE